jgi:lysozyme
MKTSKSGLEFIVREEGVVLGPYHCRPDPPDKCTWYVGHVELPGDRDKDEFQPPYTRGKALTVLSWDVAKCEAQIAKSVTASVNQNQYDALVSLGFNIGCAGLAGSNVVRLFNGGAVQGAADAFLQWCRAGSDPTFLLGRRQRERALFLTPPTEEPIDVTMFDLWSLVDLTPHAKDGNDG